jgi:hypothetical protein
MSRLVGQSTEIICTLPWAIPGENNGKVRSNPASGTFLILRHSWSVRKSSVNEIHTVLTLP